ncbi:MAG: 50S ribosomal protein L10 [Elusimicrobia bacterium]|nr:50S ribosomal protein L10 [Elusimicrobiota bacterium]
MNLTREQKKEKAKLLAEDFRSSSGVFFASYQGLKFKDIAVLRDKLTPAKCKFRVIRNTVMANALKGAEISAPQATLLKGPTAVTIQNGGDIAVAAKVLRKIQVRLRPEAGLQGKIQPLAPTGINAKAAIKTKGEHNGNKA